MRTDFLEHGFWGLLTPGSLALTTQRSRGPPSLHSEAQDAEPGGFQASALDSLGAPLGLLSGKVHLIKGSVLLEGPAI